MFKFLAAHEHSPVPVFCCLLPLCTYTGLICLGVKVLMQSFSNVSYLFLFVCSCSNIFIS